MIYTVKLTESDIAGLKQTVREAYRAGQDMEKSEAEDRQGYSDYFTRLLNQIEKQAQAIAEQAFDAGLKSPRL